jgi:6-phosphogluconolactonase (cycloisomerase 2 family)
MVPHMLGTIGVVSALMATGVPVPAATSDGRPLYVTNRATDDITVFRIGATGRLTTAGDRVPAGDEPRGIVLSPDGRHAYVVNGGEDGAVSAYTVNGHGGLDPLETAPTGGSTGFGIAINPGGTALYVTNIDSGTVTVFAIGADGRLTRVGEPVTTGADSPRAVAVSPDGRLVFVSHGVPDEGRDDVVVTYAARKDGTLTPVGAPAPVGSGGNGLTVSPDGRFLYVVSTGGDQVFGFGIGRDGGLTPVPRSPFRTADFPEGIATTPDGRHLFVTSPGSERPDDARAVSAFTIQPDGALRAVPGSPFQAGRGPVGIAATPDGRHLYVSNFDSADVSAFGIGSAGALRKIGDFPTGGSSPSFESVAVLPDPPR